MNSLIARRTKPPPERRRPAERKTPAGREVDRGADDSSLGRRQEQAQHLVDLMTQAQLRGDRAQAERHWVELRRLVLSRSPADVAEMERAMGLGDS